MTHDPTSKIPPVATVDVFARRLDLPGPNVWHFVRRLAEVQVDGVVDVDASKANASRFRAGLDRSAQLWVLAAMVATFEGPRTRYAPRAPLVRKLLAQVEADERAEYLDATGWQATIRATGDVLTKQADDLRTATEDHLVGWFGWERDDETALVAELSAHKFMAFLGQLPGMGDRLPAPFGTGK